MARKNLLSAASSPNQVRMGGVRRLNNLPIIIVGGIAFAALAIICWVAASRGNQTAKPKDEDHGGSTMQVAQNLAGERLGGIVPKAKPAPGQAGVIPAVATVPAAPVAAPTPDELEKQRKEAYQLALRAKVGIQDGGFQQLSQEKQRLDAQRIALLQKADPNNSTEVLDEYRRELAEAKGMIGSPNGQNDSERNPNDLANFTGPRNRWDLASRRQWPKTPFVLQTGSIIPAVAVTAMDSDLPGSVTAQVSQNVYDSPNGRFLLIPQGSRLYGEYVSKPEYGQSRIFVAWERILFPDGSTFDLGAMAGADEQGQSGFHDQTDNHYLRTFGSALVMSVVTGGIGLTQGGQSRGGYGAPDFGSEMSQALGQNLGSVVSELTRKNLSIPPSIRVRPGYRFAVAVSKDLTFRSPYHVPAY